MNSQDKALQALLELGDPAERRTRMEVLERALRTAMLLTDADAVALTTHQRGGERLLLHSGSVATALMPLPLHGSEVVRRFDEAAQPIALDDLSEDKVLAVSETCPGVESGPVMFTPVRRRDQPAGYLTIYRRRGRARFGMHEQRAMLLLSAWLGAVLDHLKLATGNERLAIIDPLTEVYNFRHLKSVLRRETRRASRYGQDLSIVRLGVDGFESHVSTLGDLKSGLLLKELATVLAQQVRSFDVLARHGGGFVVTLPQTPRDAAAEVAERMRSAIEAHPLKFDSHGSITVSGGVASFPQDGAEIGHLLTAVDRALEQARERGGNCVVTLSSAPAMPSLPTLIARRTSA
jgi:diguanylate cyclase (GGDEF)-like protein